MSDTPAQHRGLTVLETNFVREYPSAATKADAMRKAGSKAKSVQALTTHAERMLKKDEVQRALAEREREITERSNWTIERYIERIELELNGSPDGKIARCDRKADALAALRLLGEATALLKQRSEISIVQLDAFAKSVLDAIQDTLSELAANGAMTQAQADSVRSGVCRRMETG